MGGSNLSRSEHTPFRIEPERGKVLKDDIKALGSEVWGVLDEYELRSYFGDDSEHFFPEPRSRP
jgi:hypothetical protein